MLVALSLTPMLCSRFLHVQSRHGRVYLWIESVYVRMEAGYRRALAWGLRHRFAVVAMSLVAVLIGVGIARSVPKEFLTAEDRSEFNIWLKLPLGSTIDQTLTATAAVEAQLQSIPQVTDVFSTIGAGAKKRVNEAQIYVQLLEKHARVPTQQQIMVDMRGRIGDLRLGLDEFAVEEVGMIDARSRHSELMYSIRGPDIDRLQYYANALVGRMQQAGGYADLHLSYETGKPEIALHIARERAADLGVPALSIGRTVSTLFAGYKATTFEEGGERYDVRVQVRPEYRDDLERLGMVQVRSAGGALVPLQNLVTPRIGSGPVQIDRENRSRSITLYANLDGKAAGTADEEIAAFASDIGIGGQYQFEPVGPSKRLRETFDAIAFAFVLALIAIYMILASQFNSFVHPFTIMLSAPLSFIGAFAAIALMGASLDLMGQIAFLMLMGIVMKNGILLVDYTNTLRSRGRSLREAVLEAGPIRMRPVLMTAGSTICGMLPVALGTGDGSEWRSPMGMIAIGGLATSTFLTLLVVPVAYTLVDDAQSLVVRALRRVRGTPVDRGAGPRPVGRKAA
jgi:HAE1 family hydrophobic/amphiphilic exporter-1